LSDAVARLQDAGLSVSLFLDPTPAQIEVAAGLQVDAVELHTGQYASASAAERPGQLQQLQAAAALIRQAGLALHAGHGLNYHNVRPVAAIREMRELNIGHAIVARAVMVGMQQAVRDMRALLVP
jgi:pyridoxine 5-phosphate synthase